MKTTIVKAIGIVAAIAALSSPALAAGDAAAGKKIYNKCKACHALTEGKNKVGPSLFGRIGQPAAAVKGFKYSKAMKGADLTWDEATLTKFLTKPKTMVPGTRMAFPGLKKPADIANLIAYLKANGG